MAEKDTTPDDLQLKKRARRRLLGAAALALFAVIVLPMVMDREPRPLSQDIQVRIPSQDSTGFASKLLPGKPAATPMPAPEPKPVDQKAEIQTQPETAHAATDVPASKPVAQASVAPPGKPADKPPVQEKKPEAAEKAVPRAPSDAKPAIDGAGQWVIQLGAYKEASKVKNLMSKLKGINVTAYTEKVEMPQGSLMRVRAGPFASQEAAERARGRLKIIGVDGPVAPK